MPAEARLIVNFSNGRSVCDRAALADRPLRRMRGLLGRRCLDPGEGLLLRPAPSIHTAFMRFPIDAVFLDAELQVVGVVENMGPWRVAGRRHARAVLELAAGEVDRCGVGVGDRLVVLDADPVGGADKPGSNADGRSAPIESFKTASIKTAFDPVSPEPGDRRPLRVLLIAQDHRFRTVAAALLSRRGLAVSTSANADRVVEVVARERADVVVVDVGEELTSAARIAATVGALEPPVGVVLVDGEAENGLSNMPVLAKWGPFDELFAAIEQADRERGRGSRLVG